MEETVIHTTEVIGGKPYPTVITRQHGTQEIEVRGKMVRVVDVTITENALGRTRCYTRKQTDMTAEGWEAVKRRTQELAAKAMIDQGIW